MAEPVDVPTATAELPNGAMPLVGFGTWQLTGAVASAAVATALEVGYRHLDTAQMYRNEAEVGRALAESGVPRDQVFLTTKYNPRSGDAERDVLQRSLDALGVDAVDLWLIHAPAEARNEQIWASFVAAQQDGLARDIGVSNFSLNQIDALTNASGVTPAVNQISWRPALHDPAALEGHRERGVVLQGYSGLRHGALDDPAVRRSAEAHERTPAQVIIRWHLQHGIVVIPRSQDPERIRANADVDGFELTEEEMAAIDATR